MTILMVTHDIAEAFKLGTRLIVFDKVRHDVDPATVGATITYDLPLRRPAATADDIAGASVAAATMLDRSLSMLSKDKMADPGDAQ